MGIMFMEEVVVMKMMIVVETVFVWKVNVCAIVGMSVVTALL